MSLTMMLRNGRHALLALLALGAMVLVVPALANTIRYKDPIVDPINTDKETPFFTFGSVLGPDNITPFRYEAGISSTSNGSWVFYSTAGDPYESFDDHHYLIQSNNTFIYDPETPAMEYPFGAYVPPGLTNITRLSTTGYNDEQNYGFQKHEIRNAISGQLVFTLEFRLALVRDIAKYEYRITNHTSKAKSFGLRAYQRVFFREEERPYQAYEYFLPGHDAYQTGKEFVGNDVPTEWFIRKGAGGDWKARQILDPTVEGITRPDRLVFERQRSLEKYTWPYLMGGGAFDLIPGLAGYRYGGFFVGDGDDQVVRQPLDPLGDWAQSQFVCGQYYNPKPVRAGETMIIRGEYRFDWVRQTLDNGFYAGVQAPEALNYNIGDDPRTVDVQEDGYFEPAQIRISAYAFHTQDKLTVPVSFALTLPDGLAPYTGETLARPAELLQGVYMDREAPFDVVATGTEAGNLPVILKATFGTGTLARTLSAKTYINVPARETHRYATGPHLTGFPFDFYVDANPEDVLLGLGDSVQIARWDPRVRRYIKPNDAQPLKITPGAGYWLNIPSGSPLLRLNSAMSVPYDYYTIPLYKGWNMISNPYGYGIEWNTCRIIDGTTSYTPNLAVARGLIRQYLYQWDDINDVYISPLTVSTTGSYKMDLKPYVGYWIYADKNVQLTFKQTEFLDWESGPAPAALPSIPGTTRALTSPAVPGSEWAVNVEVATGSAKDTLNTFGVSTAADVVQLRQMLEPPISPLGLSAYFVPRDATGQTLENAAVEYQAPLATNAWTFVVECTQPSQTVTLRWPDLRSVPSAVPLFLKDESTGKTVNLRKQTTYSYNSGSGGVRQFTISTSGRVEPVTMTSFRSTAGTRPGSLVVSYTLSGVAPVTVRFRTTGGKLVRTLTAPDGQMGSISWDGLDDAGRKVRAGMYLCEFFVQGPNGLVKQDVRMVKLP